MFGSDLLGAMQTAQCEEFALRATVEPRWDTLRSATVLAAQLFQEEGDGGIGRVAQGYRADLILVDAIEHLSTPDTNLKVVVKNGVPVLNRMPSTQSVDVGAAL